MNDHENQLTDEEVFRRFPLLKEFAKAIDEADKRHSKDNDKK